MGVTERISRILTLVATVEMPPPGTSLTSGDELATIEDQKAVIEIPAPAPLEVVALNNKVIADPMLVRMDPYGRGWLMRVRLYEDGWEELLDATAYQEVIERQTR